MRYRKDAQPSKENKQEEINNVNRFSVLEEMSLKGEDNENKSASRNSIESNEEMKSGAESISYTLPTMGKNDSLVSNKELTKTGKEKKWMKCIRKVDNYNKKCNEDN